MPQGCLAPHATGEAQVREPAWTPTFFINGKPYSGFMSIEPFSCLIDPLLSPGEGGSVV